MAQKAYYEGPFVKRFNAKVISKRPEGEMTCIALDRTYFYPESGGQPNDTGRIDGKNVVNVVIDKDEIYHFIKGDVRDLNVECEIDWERRMDNMQQHTGQHILSQAIYKVLGKESESLHIGRATSSIDIESGEITQRELDEIERIANGAVMEDIHIKSYFVDSTDGMDLRKDTQIEKNIRIVDIEGYDRTPCGGTHLDSTGKVGPIKIVKCFKKGKYQRIEFVCGWRCLDLMGEQMVLQKSLSNLLMVPPEEVLGKVNELASERKELSKRNKELEEELLEKRAYELIENAEVCGTIKVICSVMDDPSLVQHISKTIPQMKGVASFLAFRTEKGATLMYSSSKDSGIDAGALLKDSLEILKGKGGGGKNFASGSCVDTKGLEDELHRIVGIIMGN